MQVATHPPRTIDELVQRAQSLAGYTLGELAEQANIRIPDNFKREKGWTGQLLELYLGAEAGSKPQQDFPELGVELKTIPVNQHGHPLETTYVCYCPVAGNAGLVWQTSNVRNKLANVLWVPVQGERHIQPAQRTVGYAFLWQPNQQQQALLQQDWEELMELIAMGNIESITAKHGQAMQLRPKAANGSVVTDGVGKEGETVKTRPRGFYLRKEFTHHILQQAFN